MIKAGAAAVHIEDQVSAKRCGHRPGKELVPDGRNGRPHQGRRRCAHRSTHFVIMARTDALASEGLARAIERAQAYVAAGADMIFAEAVTELPMYTEFRKAVGVPILANITEFGQTPLFTREELAAAGVDIILYCCAAYRAMNAAALKVYETIRAEGTQKSVLPLMQTPRRSLQISRTTTPTRRSSTSSSPKKRARANRSMRPTMETNLENTIAVLERTPAALDALLRGLPEMWTQRNEGENTWCAAEVVGHLIHGERTRLDSSERSGFLRSENPKPFERIRPARPLALEPGKDTGSVAR